MSIAFFDLDRTLISKNSGSLWVKSEFRGGYIGYFQALEGAFWLFGYHMGVADIEAPLRKAVATLRGELETEIRVRTGKFYEDEVKQLYRPGAYAALKTHREAGDECVLLTTSSNYLSELVQTDLGLDGILCNRFEIDENGRYTGNPIEPLCFGAGKITHAKRYAYQRGVDLADCAFYTDSYSDLPMLEVAGRAVAINPDPRLSKAAKRRGWPVEDWGE